MYLAAAIKDGKFSAPIKIGISKNPEKRIEDISKNMPYDISLVHVFTFKNKREAEFFEHGFHKKYKTQSLKGEWYDLIPSGALHWLIGHFHGYFARRMNKLDTPEGDANLDKFLYDAHGVTEAKQKIEQYNQREAA